MEELIKFLEQNNIPHERNVSASKLTSFRTGGEVRLVVSPASYLELFETARMLRELKTEWRVLGRGTNLLVSDAGYGGVMLSLSGMKNITVCDDRIVAQSGATLRAVAAAAQRAGLTGLEFAHGIPGSVGGAVYMNAGAYGSEMSDVIELCECLNMRNGKLVSLNKDDLRLSYRYSILKDAPHLVVISTHFALKHGEKDAIAQEMERLHRARADKQPLEYPSAGSTFKRPQGDYAGRLIEAAGLKGYTVGGAAVSEKHAGFVVNLGGATSTDVLAVIEHVKNTVLAESGVLLETEIEII